MAEILTTIGTAVGAVTQVNDYVLAPVMNQFSYLFFYKTNIEILIAQIEELNQTRDNLQLEVDAAKRNIEAIGHDVEEWLKRVAEINAKKDRIIQDRARLQQGCFYGRCPNIKLRYCLSREAKNATEGAVKLLQVASNFRKISYPAKPEPITVAAAASEFDSRKSKEEEIMNALKDDKVYVIAVCGMGGVGKTTMVKKIENRVREAKMFDEVVMAVVSRSLDLHKVQQEIAERLGLQNINKQITVNARADSLHKRLKDTKSVLIILDDVWEMFNLQEIGIPSKSSQEGCKIILTSRIPSVCRKIEDSAKIIKLEILAQPEAWNLFKEKAGEVVDTPDLHPIAVNVAQECQGLPLALVTVAAALRDLSVRSWEDAFEQLKRSMATDIEGVSEEMYVPLKWSYDQLRNEEARYLFLLCGLFPEDYEIPLETLVRSVFSLHKFAGVENLAKARNRVYRLIEILKDRFLLITGTSTFREDGAEYDYVKMHDVIRDMAILIASQEKYGFLVIHDKDLSEWPNKNSYDNYICISLRSLCKISFPEDINCSRLELLRLSFFGRVEIPESSLHGMRRLKVLITHMVRSLPSSLSLLINLRSLFLEWTWIEKLPDEIGELVNLEILCLANSWIRMLQKEIGRLKSLKLLDLTRCRLLQNIAPGVISGLVQLEELYMLASFTNWEAEGVERNNASVAEVACLTKLTTLHIEVPKQDTMNFIEDTQNWHKLTRFNVVIGSSNPELDVFHRQIDMVLFDKRKISLFLIELVHLTDPVRVILDNADVIELSGEGSGEIANHLRRSGFQNVKKLYLQRCGNLEVLFDSSSWNLPNSTAFLPRAKELTIFDMDFFLKEVCRGHPPAGSFSNLKKISLSGCNGLKNLFSSSIAAMLSNLETIQIRKCYFMETVFLEQNGQCGSKAISQMAFPKLSEITLADLQSLRAFCKATDTIAAEFPQLKGLVLINVPSIQQFCQVNPPSVELPSLEELSIENWRCMEIYFRSSAADIRSFFDGEVYRGHPPAGSFSNLKKISLSGCIGLKNLFSSSIAAMLSNLETIQIRKCYFMEIVFLEQNGQCGSKAISKMAFPKLSQITLADLQSLCAFCKATDTIAAEFPQPKELVLFNLPEIQQFCQVNPPGVELPLLEVLSIENCWCMDIFFRSSAASDSNIGIRSFFDGVTFNRLRALKLDSVIAPTLFGCRNFAANFNELEQLVVMNCDILEEVICKKDEEDETNSTEILFPKLKSLGLYDLPMLIRFCHIKHDVKLPSLEKAIIKSCPSLETFSLGAVYIPSSADVTLTENLANQYFIKEQQDT